MSFLVPQRQFDADLPEMIDLPNNDPAVLDDDLKNLRTINKYFGGLSAVKKEIVRLFDKISKADKIEILDLATGSADHPLAILTLSQKWRRPVAITAVDKNPQILAIARERTKLFKEIQIERQDILALPYPDKSFDIVLASLVIHHFSRQDAVRLLKEMDRLSRIGFVLNDLRRSWLAAATAWLYTRLTTRNPMTLNDSYLSVLRAFTADELQKIAQAAGIKNFKIKKRFLFRLILTGEF
jgi:ubiquinone/menaquinone biosynthesis C-methylase UbiE